MKFFTLSANNPGIYTTPTGNNTYLIPGAVPTLIDAGVGDGRHLEAIAERLDSAGHGALAYVLVTHAHSDHASGAPAIAARWPGVRFLKLAWPERDERYGVSWQFLSDGEEVAAGDDRLAVVHTPGHAPDHACFWHGPSRTMFCGDLAVRGTSVVIPGRRGGSVADYLGSIARVRGMNPSVLLPAHGPAIHGVDDTLRNCIAHRLEREQQIADALASAPMSIDELVTALYPGLHPQLGEPARASVTAHLDKLQAEGRAVETSTGRWELSAPSSTSSR